MTNTSTSPNGNAISRQPRRRPQRLNLLELPLDDYRGSDSTLCPGCGHNSISTAIIRAAHELSVPPHMFAKMSGIGCSSKTPAYFLWQSSGFNSVHGRMPSVTTGAVVGNKDLTYVGVSGDGDTASIGIGQFVHATRRNVPMVYIVENNGVYGLTKGQLSATADHGTTNKRGTPNQLNAIDLCELAIQLGCGFVARSFSGAQKQLIPLLKAALSHNGTAVIDVISPCVMFNDHSGSTRSYDYVRDHESELHDLDFIPHFEPIEQINLQPGITKPIRLHDGSHIVLKELDTHHDPHDRMQAIIAIEQATTKGQHLTGLIYHDPDQPDLIETLHLTSTPLAHLEDERLRPKPEAIEAIFDEYTASAMAPGP